jgi:flagellar basal-body rod protein FlgC
MSFFDSLDIAASGLTAERMRMDVTAENLANAQTTRGANGQPYRRQEVVLQQSGGFGATLAGAMSNMTPMAGSPSGAPGSTGTTAGGVEVAGIVSDPTPNKLVYDPTNPDADAKGYVQMPNVNPVTEMVDLISESRSYQADVTAMQTAKQMYTKTLDLLK